MQCEGDQLAGTWHLVQAVFYPMVQLIAARFHALPKDSHSAVVVRAASAYPTATVWTIYNHSRYGEAHAQIEHGAPAAVLKCALDVSVSLHGRQALSFVEKVVQAAVGHHIFRSAYIFNQKPVFTLIELSACQFGVQADQVRRNIAAAMPILPRRTRLWHVMTGIPLSHCQTQHLYWESPVFQTHKQSPQRTRRPTHLALSRRRPAPRRTETAVPRSVKTPSLLGQSWASPLLPQSSR